MDRNYQTLDRPSELEAKQHSSAARAEQLRREAEILKAGSDQAVFLGYATTDDCDAKPYRPSTLERINKELSAHAQESRRVVKLEALRQLLEANPDVARILELKAELGF